MSEICCDLCKYWLPDLKECGNMHIDVCMNKEHFVKVERNCGTCEREIYNEALEDFKNKLISDEFQKYNIDFVFETNREWDYSDCITALIDYISEVYKQMKR